MKTLPSGSLTSPDASGVRPKTWAELEARIVAAAIAAGESSEAALRAIRKDTILVRLIRAELGLQTPRKKRGPSKRPGWDNLLVGVVVSLKRDYGLRGGALWDRAHHELATDESFMGEFRNTTPGAIQRRYYRLKKGKPD